MGLNRSTWQFAIVLAMYSGGSPLLLADNTKSLPQAHAHNDYLHARPLLDAIDRGFCSVEADIFLVDHQLLVAHTRMSLSKDRTLRSLYLDPLRQRIKANGGSVHGDGQPVTLLIDIKSDAESTYRALSTLLATYDDIFTAVDNGKIRKRPVIAVVSGNRAMGMIAKDSPRYVGIDGRLSDLAKDEPSHLLPLISDHWGRNFAWRGEGKMPDSDREKLTRIVKQAHKKNRRVRFWATPDRREVWGELFDAGVDLINTDDLAGLSEFLRSRD